jgi:hypothetical protein
VPIHIRPRLKDGRPQLGRVADEHCAEYKYHGHSKTNCKRLKSFAEAKPVPKVEFDTLAIQSYWAAQADPETARYPLDMALVDLKV